YLERLAVAGRLPRDTRTSVIDHLGVRTLDQPQPDLAVLSLPEEPDLDAIRATMRRVDISCLFAHDSGTESALA
ncbi:MAG: hypothetical protein M3O70_21390, partial [Actinomycetota bacterium]|nr:hypothetical protein [Actinomycetota bacterium]